MSDPFRKSLEAIFNLREKYSGDVVIECAMNAKTRGKLWEIAVQRLGLLNTKDEMSAWETISREDDEVNDSCFSFCGCLADINKFIPDDFISLRARASDSNPLMIKIFE